MVDTKNKTKKSTKNKTKKSSKNNKQKINQKRINYKLKPNFFINPPRLIPIK